MQKLLFRSCVLGLLVPAVLWAGKLTMKDGTVYEGTIKKLGSSQYYIKLNDGTTKLVSQEDVAKIDDPSLASPGGGTSPMTGTSPGATSMAPQTPGVASGDFDRTARLADRAESPIYAISIWQTFLKAHPKGPDHDKAQIELNKWQDMAKNGAEKVKGQWKSGDELKKLHEKVDTLTTQAIEQLRGDQTLKGVETLKDILKIYPNSFPANFEMGYYNLVKITRVEGSNKLIDDSISSLETAVKLKPNSPEALTNLAIAYNWRKRYEDAVVSAYKAAQIDDRKEIVQNLYNALDNAPPGMRKNNPKVVKILSDAVVLFNRRGASKDAQWVYVRPDYRKEKERGGGGSEARKGVIGTGTGFFISDDGYIMTNRHVAGGADTMIIRQSDGSYKVAEKVVVDDEQDIAILKIVGDPKTPFPFVHLGDYDVPNVGVDVTVMGFPLGDAFGQKVKITRGVVTSIEDDEKSPCDVIVDAQVNPGNSGGPMLDKHGNLMALVAMKTLSDEKISSYGLGISPGRLRKFFEHQKDKTSPVKLVKAANMAEPALSTEEIAQKYTKATVMILMVSGDLPADLKDLMK